MSTTIEFAPMPDDTGHFGNYGGSMVPPPLEKAIAEVTTAYESIRQDPAFRKELHTLYKHYVGRPSPVFFAKRLSDAIGGERSILSGKT